MNIHAWNGGMNIIHKDVVLHRYSFVGDPTLKNHEGQEDFLFGSLYSIPSSERDFQIHLESHGARFFLVHVREALQVLENGCCIFAPEDVIEFVEE